MPAKIEATKDPEVCGKHPLVDEGLLVDSTGGLANVVVMLKSKNVPVNPEYEQTASADVVLDNKNCRFEPHVEVVRTPQSLLLKNSDPTAITATSRPLQKCRASTPLLCRRAENLSSISSRPRSGSAREVGCNIHPWMGAWLVCSQKDPYVARSLTATGKSTIKDLPAGQELEFALWQEKVGLPEKNGDVQRWQGSTAKGRSSSSTLEAGRKPDLGDIKVSASDLQEIGFWLKLALVWDTATRRQPGTCIAQAAAQSRAERKSRHLWYKTLLSSEFAYQHWRSKNGP